jgi:hypothetical protein
VVRVSHTNADGSETPVIAFYNDKLDFKIVHEYLNEASDVQRFLDISSVLSLEHLPLWTGSQAPKRTDNQFKKFARRVRTPFTVVTLKPSGDPDAAIAPKVQLVRYEPLPEPPSQD